MHTSTSIYIHVCTRLRNDRYISIGLSLKRSTTSGKNDYMLVTTRGIQIIWGGGGGWDGIRLGIVLIAIGAQSLFSKTLL